MDYQEHRRVFLQYNVVSFLKVVCLKYLLSCKQGLFHLANVRNLLQKMYFMKSCARMQQFT